MLAAQDDASALNGSKEALGFDGMADGEVERRLKVNDILIYIPLIYIP